MGDYGIKISKSGEDVMTTEDKNLVYSSGFDTMKLFERKSGTSVGGANVTLSHPLNYKAAYMAYRKPSGQFYYQYCAVRGEMKATEVVFSNLNAGDEISCLIFYNPANVGITDYTKVKTGDYGVKASQSNEDVFTAAENKLSMSSQYSTLQIRNIYEQLGPASDGTITINHNYGYIPAFLAEIETTIGGRTGYVQMPRADEVGFGAALLECRSRLNDIKIVSYGGGGVPGLDASSDMTRIILFTEALE